MTAPDKSIGGVQLPSADSPIVIWQNGACRTADGFSCTAIFPGAFNPIHDGHRGLRQAAAKFLGCPIFYELSICNVEKTKLDAREVHRRLRQISDSDVLLTNAAKFSEKANLFPGCWFVVGFDTAERILNPAYYDKQKQRRNQSLRDLRSANVKFLVAGRVGLKQLSAQFRTADQLSVDDEFRELFIGLPETCFRVDISSTAIRQQRSCTDTSKSDS